MEEIMKKLSSTLMGMAMLMTMVTPAFAVDTTKTYSSGLLVGIFLAFCALIVVVQLMPTIMLLVGFVKGLIKDHSKHGKRHASRI
jgi:prepilin signal peptidase PulO-like enzyme (type II secretory pathway)